MRETIVWFTTVDKLEQRRYISGALARVYEISWHTTDNKKVSEHMLTSNETGSVPIIRLIEIDKEFTEITLEDIGPTFLSTFDGIITQSDALADAIALTTLIPVKSLLLSNLQSESMQRYFVDEFSTFIKSIRLAKTAANTMRKVSDELTYLGVNNDSVVVDSVAKILNQLVSTR